MKKELKESKKEVNKQWSLRKRNRDANNRIIIGMTVKDDENFLSAFSENETPVISSDVAEFIESSTHSILPKEQLTLRIRSNCIDDQEKVIYRNAIREYYTERYISVKKELQRNTLISILLGIFGVIALVGALLIEQKSGNIVWTEVADIVAWVLLWEAVDISVFQNRELRVKRLRYLSFLSMNIEYCEDTY